MHLHRNSSDRVCPSPPSTGYLVLGSRCDRCCYRFPKSASSKLAFPIKHCGTPTKKAKEAKHRASEAISQLPAGTARLGPPADAWPRRPPRAPTPSHSAILILPSVSSRPSLERRLRDAPTHLLILVNQIPPQILCLGSLSLTRRSHSIIRRESSSVSGANGAVRRHHPRRGGPLKRAALYAISTCSTIQTTTRRRQCLGFTSLVTTSRP